MEKFEIALEFMLRNEGGFVNNNLDRGGATNFGITHKTLRKYRNKPVTLDDVKSLKKDEVKEIYKTMYWDPLNFDTVDLKLAVIVFDQGVNRGPRNACTQLQKLLNIKVDGIIGPVTLKAISSLDVFTLCIMYIKASQFFYVLLVKKRPGQIAFLKGWLHRTHELLDFVLKETKCNTLE